MNNHSCQETSVDHTVYSVVPQAQRLKLVFQIASASCCSGTMRTLQYTVKGKSCSASTYFLLDPFKLDPRMVPSVTSAAPKKTCSKATVSSESFD
mmetsp:Transcript_32606/g.79101  ORF Transcript_32606/g.79101 Transcript_32606/m.79101 type:complete len:95 (+) Transcript_32606:791-1075(+)